MVTGHLDETVQEECVAKREKEFLARSSKGALGGSGPRVKGGERGPNTGARSRQSKETSGGLRQKPAGHTEPAALESHPGALSWLSRDGD